MAGPLSRTGCGRAAPLLSALTLAFALALPASAHFQEILPEADVLPEGGEAVLSLVFTHPFDAGPAMEMARPVRVGVLAGGRAADLTAEIVAAPVEGRAAWRLSHALREPGAAVFFVEPQPYWEPAEGKYIVHYAKVIVDAFASGDGWDALVGLPVEIRPLTRPTGLWTGNLFSGVVLRHGRPVPFAEVEVEFVNDGSLRAPNDAFVTQVVRADANGTFAYAMPRGGWWGFAALTEGEATRPAPDGTAAPVEEGALIWIRATDPVAD